MVGAWLCAADCLSESLPAALHWQTMAHEVAHNAPDSDAHNEAFARAMGLVASGHMQQLMLFLRDRPAEP